MIPRNVARIDYRSDQDGCEDWALALPPEHGDTWIVCLHGHGSHGDQLYTRPDIRDHWLPEFRKYGCGVLTPNLRGNAWMAPAAAFDLHTLLNRVRHDYAARHFIFASGSMGGTGNLIYAVLYPQDVAAAVALGAATDLATYHDWCRHENAGVVKEIADAIESAYGGAPAEVPDLYREHSTRRQSGVLTMPVYLVHGGDDVIIPVSEARALAEGMAAARTFVYHEIPGGNHDAPLWQMPQALEWVMTRL